MPFCTCIYLVSYVAGTSKRCDCQLAIAMASAGSKTALVLLDCQQSFVSGIWMSGIGKTDVEPIVAAFDKIADLLPKLSTDVKVMMSQCPFPAPSDFDLYPPVQTAVMKRGADTIKRVIKPGNSILRASGAIHWLDTAIFESGVRTVIVAGCTLTSCVRVTALDIQKRYGANAAGFQTGVDLSLCGARSCNYVVRCNSCMGAYLRGFDTGQCTHIYDVLLQSPVGKTVSDLRDAGVRVYDSFDWSTYLT